MMWRTPDFVKIPGLRSWSIKVSGNDRQWDGAQ